MGNYSLTSELRAPEFDLAREAGYSAILSVDLHGHFDLDEVEQIFDRLVRDGELCDEFGVAGCPAGELDDGELDGGPLMVEHCYRVDQPVSEEDSETGEPYTEWVYLPADDGMGRTDGVLVTRLERTVGWLDRMCWAHPFEPASAGLPVVQHPDYERWARGEYLWCCAACTRQLSAEAKLWTEQRMRQFDLLKVRGLRDSFGPGGIMPARLWEAR